MIIWRKYNFSAAISARRFIVFKIVQSFYPTAYSFFFQKKESKKNGLNAEDFTLCKVCRRLRLLKPQAFKKSRPKPYSYKAAFCLRSEQCTQKNNPEITVYISLFSTCISRWVSSRLIYMSTGISEEKEAYTQQSEQQSH